MPLAVEAGREQADHGGCEQEPDQRERDDGKRHGAEHVVEEPVGAALAFRLLDAQPHRHEGGVESAFGQQPPEEIDDLQDREEGVGKTPAPSIAAMPTSRRNPRSRDKRVALPTVVMLRASDMKHGLRCYFRGLPPTTSSR